MADEREPAPSELTFDDVLDAVQESHAEAELLDAGEGVHSTREPQCEQRGGGGALMEALAQAAATQREAAARRFEEHAAERQRKIEVLGSPGGLAEADTRERVAKRIDRLSRYSAGAELPVLPLEAAGADPAPIVAAALERAAAAAPSASGVAAAAASAAGEARDAGVEAAGVMLERIINTADFVDIRYLEGGVAAARAVGRVVIRDEAGRLAGYGTGSLVSPRLLLTNHHVLPDGGVAERSAVEFNYQDGLDGQPLQPKLFRLDPGALFLADEERDFALVAVEAPPAALAEFGFNRLIEAEGKAIIGDFVTIIQHPGGEKKQISLRENRIVDLVESFLHYEADTEPGSSGSPVFNDQWEVVALHHASVPAPGHAELGGFMNEGIRVSRLLQFIHAQNLPAGATSLVQNLLAPERLALSSTLPSAPEAPPEQVLQVARTSDIETDDARYSGQEASLTVPLELSLRIASGAVPGPQARTRSPRLASGQEAIDIDPDYPARVGYEPSFLESGHDVPLPALNEEQLTRVATNALAAGEPNHVLPYHHYSVVLNKERGLAFFAAGNIDGRRSFRLKRESDRWFLDPRVPEEEQTGEAVYAGNDLDRGHLVRRLDPAWGDSEAEAKLANDDTFHFTNCTPQHKNFNQNQTTWAGLEDYLLENAENLDLKVSIFTGPVLAEDDDEYRGVKLPRQFWKVAVMVKEGGELSATGYLLSQESLIEGLEVALEEFSYGAYSTFQVPVRRVEELTGLSFGDLANADPLEGLEAAMAPREVTRFTDLIV